MAEIVQVPGPCEILVGTGSTAALEHLGWTVGGAEIEEQVKLAEVFGDQNGGEEGLPIEWQHLGCMDVVTLEFSKLDFTVAQKVSQRINPGLSSYGGTIAAGTSPTPGTLILATTSYYRLLLNPTNSTFIRNYLIGIPIDPITSNIGTRFQKRLQRWMCFPPVGGGTLWNVTNT